MKTREFIYTIHYASRRRLAGGTNYTIEVFENRGAGKLIPLGITKCCTASHRGEACEAWSIVVQARPRIMRRFTKDGQTDRHYCFWRELVNAKVMLTKLP